MTSKIHEYGLHLLNSQIKLNVEKVVSHAADFFAFLIHKVVCFLFLFMHCLILLSYLLP